MAYYCYILANRQYGTLYVGVTNDLVRRVYEHKSGMIEGHTPKHQIHRLVWYEVHTDIEQAILREKQLKKWKRPWKYRLIRSLNPEWKDLYDTVAG